MPKIQKQFHLEITVEQFLNSCSLLELQELDLLLDGYLKKAQHSAMRESYRSGGEPVEELVFHDQPILPEAPKSLDFNDDF